MIRHLSPARWQSRLAQPAWRYRAAVLSRATAAAVAGYVVTSLLVIALALWLPQSRTDAALTATLVSLFIYAALVMLAFATRTALRAWLWLGGLAAVAGGAWLLAAA